MNRQKDQLANHLTNGLTPDLTNKLPIKMHHPAVRTLPRKAKLRPPELVILPEAGGFPPLPFLLTRDGCRTLRIRVRPDGAVEVKIPLRVSSSEALQAVERKRNWIENKREFFRSRPQPVQRRYESGEPFYYLGRPFALRLEENAGIPSVRLPLACLHGTELLVCGAALNPVRVQRAIELWRNGLDQRLFIRRLRRLHDQSSQKLGDAFPLPSLRVRALKRRWGSCARRKPALALSGAQSGALPAAPPVTPTFGLVPTLTAVHEVTLARQLSAAPLECIDYVILHELCHMRHMDHGPHFHALLRRLLPDAPTRARRLHLWNIEHPKD